MGLSRPKSTFEGFEADEACPHIFTLPLEIRQMIYEYIFPGDIYPYPSARCRRLTGLGSAALARLNPDIAALLVNKQYYVEASDVMFRRSRFCIDFIGLLARLMKSKSLPRISRMLLILENDHYKKLFDPEPTLTSASYARSSAAMMFGQMGLRKLELCIVYPAPSRAESTNYCQKTAVDFVLRAALPYVAWHPVEVYGYIQLEQKRSFEVRCAAMRRRYLDWLDLKPLGCESGLPSEFIEWEEDDGGVSLVERASTSDYENEVEVSPEEGCQCEEKGSNFAWKVVGADN